ncbi:Crp/Fnr family transcriptional regulator [Dyadobacter sp. CY312]|uniref:Crp/Fnr family transcriptional regulator n=1 Tax=Dyadobacter sp. CY312 TaxID=2907303 RepID=UPI001F3D68C2|nr:Crp/Fnr family transcriptional regulator [Dyadobacter sp. CY312]MCE7041609.1 Crp/Fnr family transcriptional regulator [Dyadobacter sp. CY312]
MNPFLEYLNSIVPVNEEVQMAISNITVRRELPENTLLFKQGDICKEFHYLEKGIARVFYYKDGKDVTAWFSSEGQIVSAIDSLFTGQSSFYNIQLAENTVLWSLQFDKIETVFEAYPIVERLGRLMITQNYLLLDERMKLFAFCSAEERYEKLLVQIPDITQRVKLGYVASYLGISQEHLSRIRSGLRK